MSRFPSHRDFVALGALMAAATMLVGWSPCAAAQTKGWASGNKRSAPPVDELVPEMSDDESYTERYTFSANLDDGGQLGVDFTISNLGWGDGQGAVQVRLDNDDAQDYKVTHKFDEDDWSYSSKNLHLKMGQTSVKALGNGRFEIKHNGGKVKIDVVFDNTMSMWMPGDGRVDTNEGYYKFHLIGARANVSGRVFAGGKWHKIAANKTGYADHVATNVAPFDFGERFMRMRTTNQSKGVFIMWREIKTTADLGGKSMTWVMVGYKDHVVFSDPDATIKFGRTATDPKTGYKVPLSLQIDAKSGGDSIKLVVRGKRFDRKDLLASYGSAVRALASTMTEPYSYNVPAKYTLKMTIGGANAVVSGTSHFVADILN